MQALEKIIERDFFPDLPRLRAQNEYLTAMETNDSEKLQEICRKYNTPRPSQRMHHEPFSLSSQKNNNKSILLIL
jgi:hypothetical protein